MDRRAIDVSGTVQGVGFRPFVYDLASRLGLRGFVKNRTGGVLIEVEGDSRSLDCFLDELTTGPPSLACIDKVAWAPRPLRRDAGFTIESSEPDAARSIFLPCDMFSTFARSAKSIRARLSGTWNSCQMCIFKAGY